MQDKSTTTTDDAKATTGANSVGPFNENELLDFAKKAVNVLGIDFDQLEGTKKEAFVGQAIGALSGMAPTKIDDLYGKTDPAVTIEFRKLVLQEARNSPKWDQDEFVAGYQYNGTIGKKSSVETEGLQHSTR
jgi:hypothetical protein